MANTTWNPSDKTAAGTLSGGNLTFTTATNCGVRTPARWSTGKYYWEYICTLAGGSSTALGVGNADTPLSSVANFGTSACYVYLGSGVIGINGGGSGFSLGTRANGDIIGVALDLDNKRIWFRVAPSGNWNGNASANPATGVNGVSVVSLSSDNILRPLYGLAAASSVGSTITANFGDSAFSGAVPAGFTSGLPDNTPPLYAANTQLAAEQWVQPNAQAQLTQLVAEQWIPAPSSTKMVTSVSLEEWAAPSPNRMVTQIALEEWVQGTASLQRLVTQVALEQWVLNPDWVPPVTANKYNRAVTVNV